MKRNVRLPAGAFLQHLGAENVRRHQVGRELDALGIEAERDAHGLDQLGLGEAGHADQQRMAAGQDRDQRVFDHPVLAEDDGADGVLCRAHMGGDLFRRAHDHVFQFFEIFAAAEAMISCPFIARASGEPWTAPEHYSNKSRQKQILLH